MNPLELIDTINDPTQSSGFRVTALNQLSRHLTRGGDIPVGPPGQEMHPTLSEEACEFFREHGLLEHALDIRSRLVNGDD